MARERKVCVEQTGVLSKRPVLASVVKTRVSGDLLSARLGRRGSGEETQGCVGGCHRGLFLDWGSGSEADNNRFGSA